MEGGGVKLAAARGYADKIADWLRPDCELVQIAGSIRRERPTCNDVDIVCVPKMFVERDMFGEALRVENVLHTRLKAYVAESKGAANFIRGEMEGGKQAILRLPKCQLDLWFAQAENFASRLLCRTGSMEHNIWLAERAQKMGMKWRPYDGIEKDGALLPAASEEDIYRQLGLEWIDPKNREIDFSRNIKS